MVKPPSRVAKSPTAKARSASNPSAGDKRFSSYSPLDTPWNPLGGPQIPPQPNIYNNGGRLSNIAGQTGNNNPNSVIKPPRISNDRRSFDSSGTFNPLRQSFGAPKQPAAPAPVVPNPAPQRPSVTHTGVGVPPLRATNPAPQRLSVTQTGVGVPPLRTSNSFQSFRGPAITPPPFQQQQSFAMREYVQPLNKGPYYL